MKVLKSRRGFTLMELVIVVLIIGILAAFGIPQYFKTIESSKADDASALVTMIGTTNRMYALDHSNTYTVGTLTSDCNDDACTGGSSACQLIACKYLSAQEWDSKPYRLGTDTPGGTLCTNATFGATGSTEFTACARRRPGAMSPYSAWGYGVDKYGKVWERGGAPAALAQ